MNYDKMKDCFASMQEKVDYALDHSDLNSIFDTLGSIDGPTIVSGSGGSYIVATFLSKILEKKNRTKAVSILVGVPILFCILSVFAMYWLPARGQEMDRNFIERFEHANYVIIHYGLKLYGENWNRSGVLVDNLFLHVLVYYGLVSLSAVTILLTWAAGRINKHRQYTELILLTTFMIYSLMENALVHMPFGFAVLLASGVIPKEDGISARFPGPLSGPSPSGSDGGRPCSLFPGW